MAEKTNGKTKVVPVEEDAHVLLKNMTARMGYPASVVIHRALVRLDAETRNETPVDREARLRAEREAFINS